MRVVIQRVHKAKVDVEGSTVGEIAQGLLLLIGVGQNSSEAIIPKMAEKIVNLRIFEDQEGKMNLSLLEIKGEILAVSQFTLYASLKKGRRPDFFDAAPPIKGEEYYEKFVTELRKFDVKVETGNFGAHMEVDFVNDGPVTIILDEKDLT